MTHDNFNALLIGATIGLIFVLGFAAYLKCKKKKPIFGDGIIRVPRGSNVYVTMYGGGGAGGSGGRGHLEVKEWIVKPGTEYCLSKNEDKK